MDTEEYSTGSTQLPHESDAFYKLSANDVQLMSILHITLYDGTCPSTRVKCITKELHEITAILMQNNRYSLCSFFFKTRLTFKVWAC